MNVLPSTSEIVTVGTYPESTIKIWNQDILVRVFNESVHNMAIISLPEGDKIITSGIGNYDIKVWDPTLGLELILSGHTNHITEIKISPDNRIVSLSQDNTLRIWNPISGECDTILYGDTEHPAYMFHFDFLPNGNLISISHNKRIKIWNLKTEETRSLTTTFIPYNFTVIDNDHIAVTPLERDNYFNIFNLVTGKVDYWNHVSGIADKVQLLPNGKILTFEQDLIRIRDSISNKILFTIYNDSYTYTKDCKILPDGKVVIGYSNGELKILDYSQTGEFEHILKAPEILSQFGSQNEILCIAVFKNQIIAGTYAGMLQIWE